MASDPNEFVGPPTKKEWDDWSDEKKAHFEQALKLADGIKLYRSAGGAGVNTQYAPHSAQLEQRGGLTSEEATNLARYRMWKMGINDIPTGERAPAETPEQVAARRDAFFKATPEQRAQMMGEQRAAVDRSHEEYFDNLVGQPKPPNKPMFVVGKPNGITEQGNIDVANRPDVENSDGSHSTVRSMGVNLGDGEVLIPTVHDSGRIMGDDEAIEHYRKTGKHLGKFKTPEDSNAYAQALHEDQEAAHRKPTMSVPFVGPQITEEEMEKAKLQPVARPTPNVPIGGITPDAIEAARDLLKRPRRRS